MHPIIEQAQKDQKQFGIPADAYQAFRSHVNGAFARGIDFQFTLQEWWAWWQVDDPVHGCIRWERRGRQINELAMARLLDMGPYSRNNVFCATASQNSAEKVSNYRKTGRRLVEYEGRPGTGPWGGKRGELHPKSKAVITPDGRFESIALAAEHHGLTRAGGYLRAKEQRMGWQFAD